MAWFDQFVRGLGTANAPFGFGPDVAPSQGPVDPAYNSGMQLIGNIGMGMLASGDRNPMRALGKSYLVAQNNAREQNKQDAVAAAMMQSAEDKKRQRQEEADKKAQFDAWVQTLPPDQQGLAKMFPDKFGAAVISQQFPDPTGAGGDSYYGVPVPYTNPDGTLGYGLPSKSGGFKPLEAPNGGKFLTPGEKTQQQAEGRAAGTITGEAKANLPGAIQQAGVTTMQIDNVLNDPNLSSVIGWNSWRPDWAATNGMIDLRSKIEQLKGDSFLQARQLLKGGGQITDYEGKRADQAYSRMELAIKSGNVEDFKNALVDFKTQVQNGVAKLQAIANGSAPDAPSASGAPSADDPLGLR